MSHCIRIIPRLDIKGPNLVKGIQLEGLRVLGKPEIFARHYYESGADELLYMDAVASLYDRNSLHDIVRRTAEHSMIPLTVGGGLRTLEDIKSILRAGADKVAINTVATRSPEIIRQAARYFGSSTIIVSIEAQRMPDGTYQAFAENGREPTGLDVMEWATRAVELGAGELLLTSVSNEGGGKGYDIELLRQISGAVPVPVIACGGAGKLEHIESVVRDGGADAICLASMLHYDLICRVKQEGTDEREGNTTFLDHGPRAYRVTPASLGQIKTHLSATGIPTRYEA